MSPLCKLMWWKSITRLVALRLSRINWSIVERWTGVGWDSEYAAVVHDHIDGHKHLRWSEESGFHTAIYIKREFSCASSLVHKPNFRPCYTKYNKYTSPADTFYDKSWRVFDVLASASISRRFKGTTINHSCDNTQFDHRHRSSWGPRHLFLDGPNYDR